MSVKYIRDTYNVPAKRGGKIRYKPQDGIEFDGIIISSRGQYLQVRLDGQKRPVTLHPAWKIEYL